MATVVTTPNLKLKVSSDLSADSKANLYKIDNLASMFLVDTNETARVRSKRNLILQPNDPDVSGSGTGGTIDIGSPDQPATTVGIYGTAINLVGTVSASTLAASSSIQLVNSGFTLTLQAPTLSSNLTLTFPNTDGTPNQVLQTDGDGNMTWGTMAGIGVGQELSQTWLAADGATKTITHGFNTRNVMVQVLDSSDNFRTVDLDSVSRPTNNTVVLESSIAPASSWTVLLKQIP